VIRGNEEGPIMDLVDDRRDAPDFGAFVRRNWRLAVTGAIVGVLLAGFAVHQKTRLYTAHASVNVQAIAGSSSNGAVQGGRTQQQVNLDTEAQLAKSTPVATRVQQLLHTPNSPSSLISRVAVSVPANSSVMVIAYTAHTPALAAAGAHDFAEAYLAQRKANAQDDINTQATQYQTQLTSLSGQLRKVTDRLPNEPGNSSAHAFDSRLAASLTNQINTLTNQLNQLTSTSVIPGSIVADASPPKSPSSPKKSLYLTTGLLLGLLIGLLLSVTRNSFDKRLRTPRDVSDIGVEVLASLPAGTPNNALFSTDHAAARAVQQMSSLVLYSVGRSSRIAVVGIGAQASNVVSNLAVALAQAEHRVAVVCAGSESRTTADLFGADAHAGLSDVLYEHARLSDVLQESRTYPGITVLAPGTDSDSDPATGAGFARVLDELRHQVDVVLIQTPPADEPGDASGHIIAGMTDGALLVVQLNQTRSDRLTDALSLLSRMSIPIIGAVTTGGGTRHRHGRGSASPTAAPIRPARPAVDRTGVSANVGVINRPPAPSYTAPAPASVPDVDPVPEVEPAHDPQSAAQPSSPAGDAVGVSADRAPHDRQAEPDPDPAPANLGWPEPGHRHGDSAGHPGP
jgi:capsular polysaccharide biosynthesis protein